MPPASPFFAVIETAAAAGIVSGYTCGGPGEPCDAQHRPYFRPNANVTRGQLSKIVVGAAGWTLLNPPAATFADVPPGSAFYDFVETAACHGIVSGYACGGPGEPCDTAAPPLLPPRRRRHARPDRQDRLRRAHQPHRMRTGEHAVASAGREPRGQWRAHYDRDLRLKPTCS